MACGILVPQPGVEPETSSQSTESYPLEHQGIPGFFVCFYFWFCWVFVAVLRLSLFAMRRGYSGCGARASHCSDFSVVENGL